jgi:hypothetical protein
MTKRIKPESSAPKFDVGSWIRLKSDAPSRNRPREYLPLPDKTYVVYWRLEPSEFSSETRYLISESVTAEVMSKMKEARTEIDVQQALFAARRLAYYVDESEIIAGSVS